MKKNFVLLTIALMLISSVACTGSQTEIVIPTPAPEQSSARVAPTVPSEPAPLPVVYYYFVDPTDNAFPEGSVVILPDSLILAPTPSDTDSGPDAAANIDSALRAMIDDSRNVWTGDDLHIASVTFGDGHAGVFLQGKIFGAGDVVLVAARRQILMTVFAEDSVQTATVTLDGESIGNLGISHSSQAQPADHVYTRAEIETLTAESAYGTP
jgi:hypothetical protein